MNIGNILSLQRSPEYPLIQVHEVLWNPLYVHVPPFSHKSIERKLICIYYNYIFIYECLPRKASSILINCYRWESFLSCEKPAKDPLELAVISNFHHWRSYVREEEGGGDFWILNSTPLTIRPRIQKNLNMRHTVKLQICRN